jgi:hypothetical protein
VPGIDFCHEAMSVIRSKCHGSVIKKRSKIDKKERKINKKEVKWIKNTTKHQYSE